jgi:hypothetical protein
LVKIAAEELGDVDALFCMADIYFNGDGIEVIESDICTHLMYALFDVMI